MFKTTEFLESQFSSAEGVLNVVSAAGFEAPNIEAVRKWFQRGSVPSAWWPVLIVALEQLNDRPVPLYEFAETGTHASIFD